jgi:pyridoxal-dependent decarboxylase-like protein
MSYAFIVTCLLYNSRYSIFKGYTVDLIAHHLTSLPERPVFRPLPPELAERFRSATLPLTGQDPEEILAEFARDIEPYPFGNGHPRFYGCQRRLQVQALEAALRQALEAGHVPITVAARAGTINSGAIDPLAALRALCDRYGLWLHVDGAYGAPAILSG